MSSKSTNFAAKPKVFLQLGVPILRDLHSERTCKDYAQIQNTISWEHKALLNTNKVNVYRHPTNLSCALLTNNKLDPGYKNHDSIACQRHCKNILSLTSSNISFGSYALKGILPLQVCKKRKKSQATYPTNSEA